MSDAEYGFFNDDNDWSKRLDVAAESRSDAFGRGRSEKECWGEVSGKCESMEHLKKECSEEKEWEREKKCDKEDRWEDDKCERGDNRRRKCRLLILIQCTEFSLIDTNLYLDTHPWDKAALAYYHKLREKLKALVRIYAEQFGPLTADMVLSRNYWTWVCQPWPWEKEC